MQLRFFLNELLDVLKALLNAAGDEFLHGFIDWHFGSEGKARSTLTGLVERSLSENLHRPVSGDHPKGSVGFIFDNFHCAFDQEFPSVCCASE